VNRAQLRTALDMIYAGTDGEGAESMHALGEVDLPDVLVLVQGEHGVGFFGSAGAADPRHFGPLLMLALEMLLGSLEHNEPRLTALQQALAACHSTPIETEH
jgi:hypothetical protein